MPIFLNSDIFFFAFMLLTALFVFWASRKEYYRDAGRRIFRNPWAIACFAVIVLYGGIAFIDSIHFKPKITDSKGDTSYGDVQSVFDVMFAKGYSGIERKDGKVVISVEKSYSKPLAELSLDKEQNKQTGEWARISLNKPGTHLLGTDKAGSDIFYKLCKGIRTALIVGLVTTMIVIPFAIFFGVMAGYFGGWVDDIIQFIYITLGSIPSILLISAMMIIVHAKFSKAAGMDVYLKDDKIVIYLCAILGLIGWSGLCRLLRAETIKLRELDYVQAAKALGENNFVIVFKHILPNLIHIVLISSILRFSGLVMVEAILAYIKIGVPSTVQSWGRIVDGARSQLARDPVIWWPVTGAFIFMFLLVLSINIFGDVVRDALDPKLRT
ncbi:ABC transporter permease [Planctomycetota bacterium]